MNRNHIRYNYYRFWYWYGGLPWILRQIVATAVFYGLTYLLVGHSTVRCFVDGEEVVGQCRVLNFKGKEIGTAPLTRRLEFGWGTVTVYPPKDAVVNMEYIGWGWISTGIGNDIGAFLGVTPPFDARFETLEAQTRITCTVNGDPHNCEVELNGSHLGVTPVEQALGVGEFRVTVYPPDWAETTIAHQEWTLTSPNGEGQNLVAEFEGL